MSQFASIKLYILLPLMVSALVAQLLMAGCNGNGDSVQAGVSFSRQVLPILQAHCVECHVPGQEGFEASAFGMSDYDSVMKGTRFGPVITPGNSIASTFITLVEGRADPTINMPHGERPPLDADQVRLLRQWIDEGAMNN